MTHCAPYLSIMHVLILLRALEMLQEFFINVVEDYKNKVEADELKKPIQAAYKKTLLPYHGWLLQQTFSVSSQCTL